MVDEFGFIHGMSPFSGVDRKLECSFPAFYSVGEILVSTVSDRFVRLLFREWDALVKFPETAYPNQWVTTV